MVLKPKKRNKYTLEGLVEEITPDNLHNEIDSGVAKGNEWWLLTMDLEELLRRYSRGERDFIAINVPDLLDVNLEGIK